MELIQAISEILRIYEISGQEIASIPKELNEREKNLTALTAMRTATRETRLFIQEKGYTPSKRISELWFDAYKTSLEIQALKNDGFLVMLYDKSRFWEDPQNWFLNPLGMELVPRLFIIEEKCDILMKKLTQ
ncbi:MAG: hypothetical protein J0M29_06545 [Chitinophagales bacterium]|nr:hypothetical protein [Chitinophagales bacterium]